MEIAGFNTLGGLTGLHGNNNGKNIDHNTRRKETTAALHFVYGINNLNQDKNGAPVIGRTQWMSIERLCFAR